MSLLMALYLMWELVMQWGPVVLEYGSVVVPLLWHFYRLYLLLRGR